MCNFAALFFYIQNTFHLQLPVCGNCIFCNFADLFNILYRSICSCPFWIAAIFFVTLVCIYVVYFVDMQFTKKASRP